CPASIRPGWTQWRQATNCGRGAHPRAQSRVVWLPSATDLSSTWSWAGSGGCSLFDYPRVSLLHSPGVPGNATPIPQKRLGRLSLPLPVLGTMSTSAFVVARGQQVITLLLSTVPLAERM